MPEPGLAEDPATRNVADFLRSEKGSGLKTKEAVQYEKVRKARLAWQKLHRPHRARAARPPRLRCPRSASSTSKVQS